jgi:chromosomal replication initiator protein
MVQAGAFALAGRTLTFPQLHPSIAAPVRTCARAPVTSITAEEAWSRLLDRARIELSEQAVATWLSPLTPDSLDDQTLTVTAPDQWSVEWNEQKHGAVLERLAPVALGHPLRIAFRVQAERVKRAQMDLFVEPAPRAATVVGTAAALVPSLSPRYTFDNFVVGKSNELAAAAAAAVAQQPGTAYNPLFIYGPTGLGKTHLMQAVAHDILQRDAAMRIVYISAEQFMNELISAINQRTTHLFRRQYRETDLLLVDDVHFISRGEQTQEEFFHTFNALYEAGRQIVLTSDRPPDEIPRLEQRLVSRFAWGMVTDIAIPDLEHRIAILRQKAAVDHLEHTLSDDVIRFVAEHVRTNVRELEGSILKLLAYASLKRSEITVALAREALRDKLRNAGDGADSATDTLVAGIQHAVAQEWGVTVDGLRSKTRTKTLTVPRQAAMYLLRQITGLQLVEIGAAFGNRDHSTVIHSLERVEDMLQSDELFRGRVEKLRKHLGSPQ